MIAALSALAPHITIAAVICLVLWALEVRSTHRAESAAKQARESELAAGSARVAAGWHGGGSR